jgi:transcriptional regulator with XRE-family HTH domain
MGQKMPELAKSDRAAKRGRPPFNPTAKHRDRVMLLTAAGITEAAIATVLGICRRTLQSYFATELATGRGVKRAQNLERLEAAAKRGNVSAMKALAQAFDRGESQELRAGETAAARRERAEAAVRERMSKRQLGQRDALTAGLDSDWGDDLLPPADWQQH